jgi:uncharacterized membrane protein
MFIIKILTLLSVALIASGWMMGSFLVVPAQKELSASEYTAVEQANTKFGSKYYPVVMGVSVILLTTLLVLTWRSGHSVVLIGASLVFVVAGVAFTAARMMPINREVDTWSVQSPPSDWQSTRDAWHMNHRIRTALAVTAFVLLSAAVVQGAQSNTKGTATGKKATTAALKS